MARLISPVVASFVTAFLPCAQALAATPSVEAFAGSVGGVANTGVPGMCSTYGAPDPENAFFPSSIAMSVPQGGIAACGYSGNAASMTAAAGPLTASQSVGPVLLGNPGYAGTYTGSADAIADFRILKAGASGTITAPGSGSPVSLNDSSAAAIFDDTLTVTSSGVTVPSTGFVRYTFAFDGSLSAPAAIVSGIQGQAGATLHIEHNGGPNFEIVRVDVTPGSMGTVQARDGSTGTFVAGVGSISGGGNFTTAQAGQSGLVDLQFTWGQPFELRAGLMATALGDCGADFKSTARLVGIEFFDTNHAPVTAVSIVSASGADYSAPGLSDAGATDAALSDASAADVQLADAPAADAAAGDASIKAMPADAGSGAVDAQLADAAGAKPSGSASHGGCSCAMAGGNVGGPVPLLLLILLMVSRLLLRSSKTEGM
jgi:hypothetical protein